MSQLAALFGVGLGLIFDPASRRTLFRRISRGSRYFFLFSAYTRTHQHRHMCFSYYVLGMSHLAMRAGKFNAGKQLSSVYG